MRYRAAENPPFSIEVEPTEGCPLKCPFCAITAIETGARGSKYAYMSLNFASTLAQQIADAGWTSTIHFSGRGEPTKNSDIWEIIWTFRKSLPNSYLLMSTNGFGLLAPDQKGIVRRVKSFFEAGLDAISCDEYVNVPWIGKVREAFRAEPPATIGELFGDRPLRIFEYPEHNLGNPQSRVRNACRLCLVAPIDQTREGVRSEENITNRCGASGPRDYSSLTRRCARPFRQMSIRYNGNTVICCHDWRGVFKVGNILQTPVDQLWDGPALNAARRKLLHHQRDFAPCLGCNATSYRVGLLPDKYGQTTMPLPTTATEEILRETVEGDSYTKPILQKWELTDKGKPKRLGD